MAAGSAQFHESTADLRPETLDTHRAIVSLMEELEAVDWYEQRVDAAGDADLAAILRHNRDEEKEHASMVLEWLRRRDPALDQHLRRYLFTAAPIAEIAEAAEVEEAAEVSGERVDSGSLGLGGLRRKEVL
jgi:ferritin-like protein